MKKDFKFKYIGRLSRSGYERGKEHWNAFKDNSHQSHILKHYILEHEDMAKEDLEIGMRVTATYRRALERQLVRLS